MGAEVRGNDDVKFTGVGSECARASKVLRSGRSRMVHDIKSEELLGLHNTWNENLLVAGEGGEGWDGTGDCAGTEVSGFVLAARRLWWWILLAAIRVSPPGSCEDVWRSE